MSMSKEDEALLDQFAAAALQGLLAHEASGWGDERPLARRAYEIATGMMGERSERRAASARARGEATQRSAASIARSGVNRPKKPTAW